MPRSLWSHSTRLAFSCALLAVLAKGVSAGLRDGVEQPGPADPPSSPGPPASPRVAEVLVDFDDFVAPESFGPPATPLRDRYLSRGVRFLGGPGTDGGAILNWRSNFSVTGYSGANFLAFNGIVGTTVSNSFIAALPEWILFTNPVAAVSIRVGSQESGGRTIHLNAFNIANATVATSSLVLGQALQTLSVSAPGIVRVEVGGSDVTVMVLDDLRFTADVVVAARETSWGRIKASYR